MNDEAEFVTKIIKLNDGRLVGKTRLQKTCYFLETLGCGAGFDFSYHFYGPYSEEVSDAVSLAVGCQLINEELQTSSTNKYSVFTTLQRLIPSNALEQKQKALLDILARFDSITIELAATADYLRKFEDEADWWQETINRKPSKATGERIERARALLVQLEDVVH